VVQDLLACIRFALQPRDDLTLAALLVSPLIGWSQKDLYDRAHGRKGGLWEHLGDAKPEALKRILNMADLSTPYRFLETILSDPAIEGRKRLIARLGGEARDPIDELLNAALMFEQQSMPSLQLFLDWFDRGEVDIKRDPGKGENAVRVMTVHGAKGLQAPVVVLADATSDPTKTRKRDLKWRPDADHEIPLFRPKKEELTQTLKSSAEAQDARETQEFWRLLYVAMTRAEEHLIVGGALKPSQQKNGLNEGCWHMRVGQALVAMGVGADDEGSLSYSGGVPSPKMRKGRHEALEQWAGSLPAWAASTAPQEAKPPRPLAPSQIKPDDEVSNPPPSPANREKAQRGILLHALFERLPSVAVDRREAAGLKWLERSAGIADAAVRSALVADALAVISDPAFAQIFAPEALAEAPLAGVVGGQVIAGTVDRLLVSDTQVLVVDFKTGRRVPHSVAQASPHHLAQMAAYAAVLQGIFPEREVRAALLYTSGPKLLALGHDDLARYKPGYQGTEDKLAASR
jgi:ATP-dependent helicase/nuclease subunit A